MTSSRDIKHTLRRICAVLLVILGALVVVYGINNWVIRSVGLLLGLLGALVVNPRAASLSPAARRRQEALALKPWYWHIGFALIGVVAVVFIWLHRDIMTGGKSIVPVYVFAVVIVLCIGWWAGLIARCLECLRTQ